MGARRSHRRHRGRQSEQHDQPLAQHEAHAPSRSLPAPSRSINSVLKIKTLPGGSRADSHYIDGLVCRLKLAHKCMRTTLGSPRILLLKPPLEHDSIGFTSSLDALRQQEDEHMEMIVGRMAKLQVDLL